MAFTFEQLDVWKRALDYTEIIHSTTLTFPKEELFVLTSQIKRATDSIALNIAEGSTGQSNAEQIKFLGYALRSAVEVVTCLYIARKRLLINDEKFVLLYDEAEILIRQIQAFRKSLKNAL
ncbi:four helix bundle protein [soil metagenome]